MNRATCFRTVLDKDILEISASDTISVHSAELVRWGGIGLKALAPFPLVPRISLFSERAKDCFLGFRRWEV